MAEDKPSTDDQNPNPDEELDDEGAGEEGDDSTPSENEGDQDTDDDSSGGDDGGDDESDDDSGDDAEEGTDDTPPADDDDKEPPVRMSHAQSQEIIARKNRQIEKLRGNKQGEDEFTPPDDYYSGDDDLTPEARKLVDKQIKESLEPFIETLGKSADEKELETLYSQEPDAKKYDKTIRRYMAHPNYKGVAASVIFHHLAFEAAQRTGAKRKSAADLEAGQNRSGGRSRRPKDRGNTPPGVPTPEELAEMSDEEFSKLQAKVLQQSRD